ncbi:MAG TPA: putative LPS assembly protein LptD [Ignavibacteriaceae bacterium]|nr:putative LPS assembly protein LptD [Ignavibacteriaceae bacterium]
MKRVILILCIFLSTGITFILTAQQQDSSGVLPADSLLRNSSDSLVAVDTTKRYDVDTVIYANSSDSLIFFINSKKMNLYGDASLQYKKTDLKSADIFVDFNTSNVEGVGIPSDTARNGFIKTPELTEGGETYEGVRMIYNFKNNQGFISSAGTKTEGAIYTGEKIKKVDRETYFIENGIYTTCDHIPPHYYFYSPEMKVVNKQQIVAKWIWLEFGGVPFPIPLPFAVFPIESGRRSGIIPPVYGEDATYGKYFSRFGYFWAISDYMDLMLTGDFFTRGSFSLNDRFRYAKRYDFNGSLDGYYSLKKANEKQDQDYSESKDWRIRWNHTQNIDPTLKFDAILEFASGSQFYRQNVSSLSEQLRNRISSNATLFKSWEESGNSLSLSYRREQDLETGQISEVLPLLAFTMSQKYPFKRAAGSGTQKWYELIGYSFNSQFENDRNKINGDLKIRGAIQHNLSISASPKFGYISVTPNFRYQERWYDKRVEKFFDPAPNEFGKDTVITNDVKEINFVRTFSLGVSASTKFFGIVQPNIFGISAIRHTVNPSVSYSYQPDFSKPYWGYFSTYKDSLGRPVKYNKYENELFGGIPSGEQQNLSFSVSNIFEMKTAADPTDTTSKENKIQLLNLGASINYNFAADSLKFSDINVNGRTQIGEYLNLQSGAVFTLYDYADGIRINKFLVNEGKGLFRLTNFNFSIGTSLSGEKIKSAFASRKQEKLPEEEFDLQEEKSGYKGIYEEKEADFSIPWDISLNYNLNISKPSPTGARTTSNVSGGFNFNLTPAWKISVSGSYDFQRKQFAAPQVVISRDLHCWLMNFTWNPIGTFRGYRFEIRVKAPQLQDLKLTKQDQFYSGKR